MTARMLLLALSLTGCLDLGETSPADDPVTPAADPLASAATTGCGRQVHVWFEATTGMDAISNDNGCWTSAELTSGAQGYGWCAEINGTLVYKHTPQAVTAFLFDDTNPTRTVARDSEQILECQAHQVKHVPGIEVMARRPDASTGALHWQKIVLSRDHTWVINHWIAELHASNDDVWSYFDAWQADPSIGHPQVNARNDGASCDARVYDAVLATCRAVGPGGTLSIVKNDGKLSYDSGCLTHVTEALNACTH